MSDFDENWQLVGTPDPATPAVQPNQIQQPAPATPYQPAPVQSAPVQPVNVQPVTAQPVVAQPVTAQPVTAQPVAPVQAQPVVQPVQPVAQPVQPVAQPVYAAPQPIPQQPIYQPSPVYGGYTYQPQPQQVVYQPADFAAAAEKRNASLAECQRILNHFAPKVDLFQKYELCNSNIEKFAKTSKAPLIWGIILALFGVFGIVSTVLETKSVHNLVPYLILWGVVTLAGAGLIVLFVLKGKSHKKKRQQYIEEAGELSNQLTILFNGFSNCILPPEYIDPRIVYKLQSIIMSGNAMTLPDALNMLLMYQRAYPKIEAAKATAASVTAERYEGKPAFFNAVSYLNLR